LKYGLAEDNGFKRLFGELTRWQDQARDSAARQPQSTEAQIQGPVGSSFYYDGGGAVGRAVPAAHASLQGPNFPSLIERSPSNFPSTAELWNAVCQTQYSAALYVTQGALARLEAAVALQEGAASSTPYNAADVMAYIWNEAVYPQVVDASISANLQLLSNPARVAYNTGNGTGHFLSLSGPLAVSVFP